MTFRDIHQGIRRRLGVLKSASEFSVLVSAVIRTLYRIPKSGNPVMNAVHDRKKGIATIYASSPKVAAKLAADAAVIRAALRREGVDVRRVSVR